VRPAEDTTLLVRACAGVRCRARARNGQSPSAAQPPALWCLACRDAAGRDLAKLPYLYGECAHALDARRGTELRERAGPATQPSLPFNTAAAEARKTLVDVLGSWCALVADERRVATPRRQADELAAFLARHLDWLSRHPAAPELSDELAGLVRLLHRAAYSSAARQIRLGACVEPECAGELVAMIGAPGRRPGTQILCRIDPAHRWDEQQWLELSRRMTTGAPAARQPAEAGQRWFGAAEIARLWQVSTGTVYRLASEEQWQRRSTAGRTRYLDADVARTFARRRSVRPGCAGTERRSLDDPRGSEEATYQHRP
jgi:hypothetical protein